MKQKLKITRKERQALKKVFENFGRTKTDEEIFYDLCFCICAPQTTFKSNQKVIQSLKDYGFYSINPLAIKLEEMHDMVRPARFYKNKTIYLLRAKEKLSEVIEKVDQWVKIYQRDDLMAIGVRDWLVTNVKGLGMKASSHFLRNMGDINLAIIDVHIIKFLAYYNVYIVPSLSSKGQYIEAEHMFQKIARENKLTTAELDALIWQRYSKTPWEEFKF